MKKILLMAAFAAVTSAGAALAQQPAAPSGAPGRGPGRGGPGGMMMDRMLLDGITLTDAQQAKLDALRAADREKMEAERGNQAGRADMEAIRAAREKGDTATAGKLIAEQRAKMEARREAQVASIRALLTADQTAKFDANVAEMKKRQAELGQGRGGRGPRPTRP